ncbi:MAG TPA: DUF6390 family protein [Acidimicrobiia bacterium]|nr:DUF6390 family protein [Acidimicrobiia bacterium]
MTTLSGAAIFARFAFPPNSLGYCGPADSGLLRELVPAGDELSDEWRHVITAFDGAWPYLELIGTSLDRDPLESEVVEAYWLGTPLLERIDLLTLGNSMEDRFRARAGWDWEMVSDALNSGGRPSHAFHVFCIYPWAGLLRSGVVTQSLQVLDRCRIRWGTVVGRAGERLLVRSQPLAWDGHTLALAPDQVEPALPPVDDDPLVPGDVVALHWDYVCQRLTPGQHRNLTRDHNRHLSMVNDAGRRLAARIES